MAFFRTPHRIFETLHRFIEAKDPRFLETFTYDANGNRRSIIASFVKPDYTKDVITNWYTYDSQNRITRSQGVLKNGTIVITSAQGVRLTYDTLGNRRSAIHYDNGVLVTEAYSYTGNNLLTTTTKNGVLASRRFYNNAAQMTQ